MINIKAKLWIAVGVTLILFGDMGSVFADSEPLPEPLETQLKEEQREKEETVEEFLRTPQYKVLLKKNTLELSPFAGPFLGDALPTAFFYGLRAQYHLNERWAVGADGGYSPTGMVPHPLGPNDPEDQDSFFVNGNVAYHFHAVILPVKHKHIQTDLFLLTGGGIFNTYGENEPAVTIGGGTKLYFHRYIVLRIDVRSYIFQSRVPPTFERGITPNTMIMMGLSFFLPTRESPFHVKVKD